MLSFIYADQSTLSKHAVLAGARTGDLILYAGAPTSAVARRHSSSPKQKACARGRQSREASTDELFVPTIGQTAEVTRASMSCTSLLAMLMPAIAFSGGERETLAELDCVGIVIERPNGEEACMLIYDVDRTLILLSLSKIVNRPACLRPLLLLASESGGSGVAAAARRVALHRFLRTTIDDLCSDRISTALHERVLQSQPYLAAHLLHSAGVITVSAQEFCTVRLNGPMTGSDIEQLFGADAPHLDMAMTRDFAYGNQIWLS